MTQASCSTWLDLFDYRQQVTNLYRERNHALTAGEDPAKVAAQWRRDRDLLFAHHSQSALDREQRQTFTGLRYFPYNAEAVVEAGVHTDIEPLRIQVVTSGDETMPLERVAELRFSLAGTQASLALYWIDVYGGGFYLCFRDTTAPMETYGGGRYLFDTVKGSDFLVPPGNTFRERILLDFNYAYNPSCAYNPLWVCPLAPPENRLSVPIQAGEMVLQGAKAC